MGCDILSMLSSKVGFADAVAKQGALWRLLSVLERPGGQEDLSEENYSRSQIDVLRKQRGWTLLETLSSSPSVANKIVETSAWLELLGILVGYAKFTKVWIARVGAAKTLSRLLWDPRTGQSIGEFSTFQFCHTQLESIILQLSFSQPHYWSDFFR